MQQMRNTKIAWAVTFPEEKMIVRRPSLKRICQNNADLAELLSYFIYEVSREATQQGIDPQLVREATIYRTQEEILYGIDYRKTQKGVMRQNIVKLEQLEFLQHSMSYHAYTVFIENIRLALAQCSQERKKPITKIKLPPSQIHLIEPSYRDMQLHQHLVSNANRSSDLINQPHDVTDLTPNVTDLTPERYISVTSGNATEPAPQAVPLPHEAAARYNRYNREIKRDSIRDGEADAVATSPSSFSVSQNSFSSSHQNHEQSVTKKELVPHEQKGYVRRSEKIAEDAKVIEKPATETPPTIEAFLALADHYRGYRLTHSTKQNSPYRLALEAATTFMNRKKTLAEVDAVFAYMKGIDENFCDDWWPMQTVDLWHVMRHFDAMIRTIVHRRAYAPGRHGNTQGIQPGQSFPIYQTAELMEMPLEERKLYLARQREQLQEQQTQQ